MIFGVYLVFMVFAPLLIPRQKMRYFMKIPRNFALYRSNNSAFLLYNGIRNAQVVGSSPTTSSMFYPLFRMEGRVFCTFSGISLHLRTPQRRFAGYLPLYI